MKLFKTSEINRQCFDLPGGKHSFAHSIACGALANECFFENVPSITDSKVIFEVLKNIFETVNFNKDKYTLDLKGPLFPKEVVISNAQLSQSRNIFCLLPALLNRAEKVVIMGVPTGCDIGERPTDWYYSILREFGVDYSEENNKIILSWREKKAAEIKFQYPTMTGTVIALACSSLVSGKSELYSCSVETSCFDQISCMKSLGVSVIGDLPNLQISNGISVNKVFYECTSDRVYAVTILTAAILAEVKFKIYSKTDIRIPEFVNFMRQLDLEVIDNGTSIEVSWKNKNTPLKAVSLEAGSEPKFSSDWVTFALLILSTKSSGKSKITDDVFLKRFQFIKYYNNEKNFDNVKLSNSIINSRPVAIAEIEGDYRKYLPGGITQKCPDIRGSAAIILSSIIASEPIGIFDQFQVSRGYEDLIGTLETIGFIKEC
jgi:UDP-N-acetylglucosamine 1-carboxyvinyltransferase